jgi:hypothetical protein
LSRHKQLEQIRMSNIARLTFTITLIGLVAATRLASGWSGPLSSYGIAAAMPGVAHV